MGVDELKNEVEFNSLLFVIANSLLACPYLGQVRWCSGES